MFPTKALAARLKWEPFFVPHNPLLSLTADSDWLLLTIWNKDHLKLISYIFEILKIFKSSFLIVVSISVRVDEDNDDGGAIPRAD